MIAGNLLWVSACHPINKSLRLKDDNFLEESFEKLIESETGLEIDLTPED